MLGNGTKLQLVLHHCKEMRHVQEPIFKRPSMASPQEKEVYVEKKGKVHHPQITTFAHRHTHLITTTENTAKNEANEDARFISFVTGLKKLTAVYHYSGFIGGL